MRSIRGIRAVAVISVCAALTLTARMGGQSAGPAPILLVVNEASPNPFGGYLAEVLRAEGVNSFSTVSLAALDATTLSNARLAVLAETPLTSGQAALFTNYVNGGGRLVAMRPDAQIAGLFGVTPLAATTTNGYLSIDEAGPGAGLASVTLPFKGTATHYNLAGATTAAALYSDRTTPTARPAVVMFNRTAAWAFDLARSTAYTRQGDPAFAGQERDGVTPIRTNDLFFGNIDLQRVGVPHADVQMRLFRRVIATLLADTQPLPRLWYFPGTSKTILLPTADSHTSTLAPHTALINAATSYGANVSLYLTRWLSIPASSVAQWRAAGHEVGVHPYFTPDNATFPQGYQTVFDWFATAGWTPASPTERHHSLEWQNWTDPVPVMQSHGIRMDTSFYAWGPSLFNPTQSNQAHGYITGSGLPMRFVTATGGVLPVYQQVTSLVDEQLVTGSYSEALSPAGALAVSRQLIDDSQNGGHSAVMTQFHVDYYTYGEVQPWVDGTFAYAQSLGIPMWTTQRWLEFTETRGATQITNTAWSAAGKQLTFSVAVPAGGAAQSVLVPDTFGEDTVTSVTLDGLAVAAASMVVNGETVRVVPVAPLAGGGARSVVVLYGTAPPAPPAVTITDVTVTEGDSGPVQAVLTLTLSKPGTDAITVDYATANGTATAGSDYTAAAGTLTFPTGTTSATVPVTVLGDTVIESNETFVVNLSSAVGADITDGQGVVTIQDDDTPPSLSIGDVAVTEGNGGTTTATFTLTLSQPSGKTITVNVATADLTATAGVDYVAASGVVTFAPGVTTQTFPVTVNGDTAVEINETFALNASAPVNVTLGDGQGVATINNDDAGPGPVSATFQVAAGGDDVNEEAGALTTAGSTVWVGNGSSATASYAGLRFTGVTVPAGATITGARLEFNAAGTQWQSLGFEFAAEASANAAAFSAASRPSQRTLLAPRVAHASNVQWVGGTWYSMDDIAPIVQAVVSQPGWAQGNALALVLRGTGQAWARKFANAFEANPTLAPRLVVTYSTAPVVLPTLSIGNASVTEGNAGTVAMSFPVTLSAASTQLVTANFATAAGTAMAGQDFVATSGAISIPAGQTSATVTVNAVGDGDNEPDETFTVTLSGAVNATIAQGTGTGTIVNDDQPNVPPVAAADSAGTLLGLPVTVNVLANDTDANNDPLSVTAVTNGARGTAVVGSGATTIVYTPLAGQCGPDSVTYTVSDGRGGTAAGTVSITIACSTSLTHTTAVDFGSCAVRAGTHVSPTGDVVLAGAFTDEFAGTALGAQWVSGAWDGSPYTAAPVDGVLSLGNAAGAFVRSDVVTFSTLDARVRFGAAPWQHVGVAGFDFATPYAIFSTFNGSTTLYARTDSGSGELQTNLGPVPPGFHDYRIARVPQGNGQDLIRYSIDGVVVAEHAGAAFPPGRYVYLSHNGGATPTLDVDHLDMAPPYGSAGSFDGCPMDAGSTVSWTQASWTATLPAGTSLALRTRTSDDLVAWSAWSDPALTASGSAVGSPPGRYLQYRLELASTDPAVSPVVDAVTISAASSAQPVVSVAGTSVTEGNAGTASVDVTVAVDPTASQEVTVAYTVAAGTATAGLDFTPSSGTLTIPAGAASGTIAVPVIGDLLDEADETIVVTLSAPVNAQLGTSSATVTILDDDGAPALSIAGTSITEGNGSVSPAVFTVSLSAATGGEVTVQYATAAGTAGAADFTAAAGTLTFAPGVTSQTVSVDVLGDTADEDDETFSVTLSAPTNATLASASAVGTIVDDDAAPALSIADASQAEGNAGTAPMAFTVSLSAASGRTVTVAYATGGGTATAGVDYTAASGTLTFAPGVTAQSIAVSVAGDTATEANETFEVTLSGATNATLADAVGVGTIASDDAAASLSINGVSVTEGNTAAVNATFTVTLSAALAQAVTVDYATASGSATSGVDFTATAGTLTIPAGALSRTVVVPVLPDVLDEDNETFTVVLGTAVGATIASGTGTGTITDNDASPSLRVNDIIVTEGAAGTATPALFTVTLSAVSGRSVTVTAASANNSATTAGGDYTALPATTVTFLPGETSRTVSVTVLGDALDEADETFYLNLTSASAASIADSRGVATIVDDDEPPVITVADASVAEGNSGSRNMTFTASLSAVSGRSVTFVFSTADGTATAGSDYRARSGVSVTIPAGSTSRTFTVTVFGDRVVEPDETFFVNMANAVNATLARIQAIGTILTDGS